MDAGSGGTEGQNSVRLGTIVMYKRLSVQVVLNSKSDHSQPPGGRLSFQQKITGFLR